VIKNQNNDSTMMHNIFETNWKTFETTMLGAIDPPTINFELFEVNFSQSSQNFHQVARSLNLDYI
jgi:hypothetical protein